MYVPSPPALLRSDPRHAYAELPACPAHDKRELYAQIPRKQAEEMHGVPEDGVDVLRGVTPHVAGDGQDEVPDRPFAPGAGFATQRRPSPDFDHIENLDQLLYEPRARARNMR